MLRQLLTLLAVFSGLTAASVPAQALDSRVQAVEITQNVAACAAQSSEFMRNWREVQARSNVDRDNFCPRPVIVISTPTVQLQADRARE